METFLPPAKWKIQKYAKKKFIKAGQKVFDQFSNSFV